ncbi:MAG: DUF3754 domain-containing protein [Phycisphaerales bacterium]|nr:DUF3754 domain-containing protein [Phycisphaerales bacterium]
MVEFPTESPEERLLREQGLDDRYLPIRPAELAQSLADDESFGPDARDVAHVANALADLIAIQAAALERDVLDRYAAFDPDRDTVSLVDIDALRGPQEFADLNRALGYVLEKANFEQLDDVQIEEAIRAANSHGLRVHVDPKRVKLLSVFVRGHTTGKLTRRSWRNPIRGVTASRRVFRRMVVIAQLADEPYLRVKMFKDIPMADLESLLPHAEVRMNLFDRLVVVGGGAGAMGSVAPKLLLLLKPALGLTQLIFLLGAFVVSSVRAALGYKRTMSKRDSQLTRHLYYQNISNNSGAIDRLVTMIEEEEVKEALLGYVFCHYRRRNGDVPELKGEIEAYLNRRFGLRVDFEIDDAIETLSRLDLWTDRAALAVIPPRDVVSRLRDLAFRAVTREYHRDNLRERGVEVFQSLDLV